MDNYQTDICVVGGGPAGMVLALLLAKRGVKVLVCESHENFNREFRGEVLMPRFSQMMEEIGLLEFLFSKPHIKLDEFKIFNRGKPVAQFQFRQIAPEKPYAVWMPQPVMLAALLEKAKSFPSFEMWFGAPAQGLLEENGRIAGIVVQKAGRKIKVSARLVVGADGRSSAVKRAGRFETAYEEHDFDLIWFNAPKPADTPNVVQAFLSRRHNYLILPKHPNLLQCGILVAPGEYGRYVQKGIGSIKEELSEAHPVLSDFARGLKDFSCFSLLQARVHFVREWAKDGCLLIGDAAHTCSPAGAVGVSVAVQTAIVAADVIYKAAQNGHFSAAALSEVQKRREADVREIQRIQKRVVGIIFPANPLLSFLLPSVFSVLARSSFFRQIQRRLFVLDAPLGVDPAFRF